MKTKKGFTLIELMVVMAIIAVLTVLVIGAINVARRSSRDTQRRANAKAIQVALEEKFASSGGKTYPAGTFNTMANINTNTGANISDPNTQERYCYYATANSTQYTLRVQTEATNPTVAAWGANCASPGEDFSSNN